MRVTTSFHQAKTVVCGISGGVDSAVSALILKLKGYNVIGLFMKNWDTVNERGVCMSDADREDAQFVCDHLAIPFCEVNFVKEYWNEVFSAFLVDLHQGKTPNPDILCNKFIKFDAFFKYAIENLGADAIATGHYVRSSAGYDIDNIDRKKGVNLLKAVDQKKCQTLFLSQISQDPLRQALFPIGDLLKQDVKRLARDAGMEHIANRRESMGICFIGKRNFQDFIEDYIEPRPGNFVNLETGEIMGYHKGAHYWTRGQRALIAGLREAMFVAEKDLDTNDIFVMSFLMESIAMRKREESNVDLSVLPKNTTTMLLTRLKRAILRFHTDIVSGTDHPALFTQTLFTEECHWINQPPRELLTGQTYKCEFRYQHLLLDNKPIECTVTLSDGNTLVVSLSQPLRALCPGQYAVFYDGDVCLGSAKIQRPGPTLYSLGQEGQRTQHAT